MKEGGCQRQEWLGVVRHIAFIVANILKYKLRKRYYQVIILYFDHWRLENQNRKIQIRKLFWEIGLVP